MLVVVLLLIVAAAAVLAVSVLTGHPQWAWLSVVLSVAGALLLLLSRRRGDRRSRRDTRAATAVEPAGGAGEDFPASGEAGPVVGENSGAEGATESSRVAVAEEAADDAASGAARRDAEVEPSEEDTDAADVLLVTESETQVRVIDERPRYHLDECSWVGRRETLRLPAREARELGFSPCAVCAPDASLAEAARAAR